MNKTTMLMPVMCVYMALLMVISRQQHMLPTIISLETTVLFMIIYLSLMMANQSMNMGPYVIILLSMGVSSTSIGLALLVITSRKSGNDTSSMKTGYLC